MTTTARTAGGGDGKSKVCAVCAYDATTVNCHECSLVYCTSCFDRLHLHIPAVQHHQKAMVEIATDETTMSLQTPTTVQPHASASTPLANEPNHSPRAPFFKPHPLHIPPPAATTPDRGWNGDVADEDHPRKKLRGLHDSTAPSFLPLQNSGGSARTRNLPPPTASSSSTSSSPSSSTYAFKKSPTSQGIQPPPSVTPSIPPSLSTFRPIQPSPTSTMAPPPPVAHLHQSPSQQSPTTFLTPSNVPSSSAPATYSPVDDDGSNALEDLFFDRFNGVNEQVDTLETQLADFVRMLSMSSAAGAAASRIQVTRQNLQVMYDEREQALAKVVVHSPLLLQRTSALLAANLQNMPELWARAYQKLKLMATHLKSAQDNLVTLQFHVTELESLDKSPNDKLCTLQQTIQNTHQYVANLRRNRQDECVALVSFSAPLRVRVADELNEQRRKGLLS